MLTIEQQIVARRLDDDAEDIWDRLGMEHDSAWEGFTHYRDMGAERSLRKVAERLGNGFSTVALWSSKFSWRMRVQAYDAEQDRQTRAWAEEERRKTIKRHAQMARVLNGKVVEALQNMNPERMTPSEIIRWAEVAMRMEREALGFHTATVGVDVGGQVDVNHLSAEDTRQRLAALQKEISERLSPEQGEIEAEVVKS